MSSIRRQNLKLELVMGHWVKETKLVQFLSVISSTVMLGFSSFSLAKAAKIAWERSGISGESMKRILYISKREMYTLTEKMS